MKLTAQQVTWGVPGKVIVRGVSLEAASGSVLGLVGPNGSGKSSLLRCLAGLRRPTSGSILYDGQDCFGWTPRQRARQVSFVEQSGTAPDDITVVDLVNLGRAPHQERWKSANAQDRSLVDEAMRDLGITHLAARRWRDLSGGERQRANIARAIAQDARCIILDEPTNHLDIRHQLDLLLQLKNCGKTVITCLHDLGLAARYCDDIAVLTDGELLAHGTPEEVLNGEVIEASFAVRADVGRGPGGEWAASYSPLPLDEELIVSTTS
ncbi:ABC transporter ATP-binding protein [Austwickia chelonae]|uniref:ABC transporter ATP-binding protein n=1 Tax=Austwickia chelonae TaxID=100225 RepID=UPI000E21F3A5|nr:ABC transporter ATP-binding protein [Austwickia chelonae]